MKANRVLLIGVLALCGAAAGPARADDMADAHAHHHMTGGTSTASVNYDLPRVRLVRDDGKVVQFPDEINDGRPVVLNFIYTTCTAICPISSTVFSQFQQKLGAERDRVHLVSISIDPEQDTPARLHAYAKRYQAGAEWNFYTSTTDASVAIQSAFHVYNGDKMSHNPVTFVRTAPGQAWLRIDGFTTADGLLQQYRNRLAAR